MARGKLIALEGIDGSGITTQANKLWAWFAKTERLAYLTKEPTNGPAGAIIQLVLRHRLLAAENRMSASPDKIQELDPATIALLFAADRIDHDTGDIRPKLDEGINVITDRYLLSSLAYQTIDLDLAWVRMINSRATKPDLTIFLDVKPQPAKSRRDKREDQQWEQHLYEKVETLKLVRQNYLNCIDVLIAEGERIEVVPGDEPSMIVHQKVIKHVKRLFSASLKNSYNPGQLDLIEKAERSYAR